MTDIQSAPTVKPDVVYVEELLDDIVEGRLLVPRFQRPFMWRPEEMLSLFDSIYKGYPIGSLLVWQTTSTVTHCDEVGPINVSQPGASSALILDGQQRLTTLVGALKLLPDSPKGPGQHDWRWWIYFDLSNEKFTHDPRGKPPKNWFPLRAALRTTDFLAEATRLQKENSGGASQFIQRAERLVQKLKYYKVAVTRIDGGNLDEAVEIFSRLNSKGQSVTADQMVSALTYREGNPTLSFRIDGIIESLKEYGFDDINRKTVFNSILAAAGKEIHSSDWEALARELKPEMGVAIDSARSSLSQAARFLCEDVGVPNAGLLPYSNQVLMLSEFFRSCQSPSVKHRQTLQKWFWVTSLSGWFAGANTTQINRGLGEMQEFAKDDSYEFKVMPLTEVARPFPSRVDTRNARVRALMLFLISLSPRDTVTGEPIHEELLLDDDGRSFDYVFPKADSDYRSSPGNRIFVRRKPNDPVWKQLCEIPEQYRDMVLESHLISPEAFKTLQEGNASDFVALRESWMKEREREHIKALVIALPPSENGDQIGEEDDVVDTGD